MLYYCDSCAKTHSLPIVEKTEKAGCQICHRFIGPVNVTDESFIPKNPETINLAGFEILEIEGFPKNPQRLDYISSDPHKIISDKMIMFIEKVSDGKSSVVMANPTTGKRIRIKI
jgi:hypothetical protein